MDWSSCSIHGTGLGGLDFRVKVRLLPVETWKKTPPCGEDFASKLHRMRDVYRSRHLGVSDVEVGEPTHMHLLREFWQKNQMLSHKESYSLKGWNPNLEETQTWFLEKKYVLQEACLLWCYIQKYTYTFEEAHFSKLFGSWSNILSTGFCLSSHILLGYANTSHILIEAAVVQVF